MGVKFVFVGPRGIVDFPKQIHKIPVGDIGLLRYNPAFIIDYLGNVLAKSGTERGVLCLSNPVQGQTCFLEVPHAVQVQEPTQGSQRHQVLDVSITLDPSTKGIGIAHFPPRLLDVQAGSQVRIRA